MPVGAKAILDRYVTDVKVKGFQKQDGSWVSFRGPSSLYTFGSDGLRDIKPVLFV